MQRYGLILVYILMVAVGLVAMYAILTAGNPASLLRTVFPNPMADVYVAAVSSFVVFGLGFIVFYTRDTQGYRHLINANRDKIQTLRRNGKSDADIADEILAAMGSSGGYRHDLARKKLLIHLAALD